MLLAHDDARAANKARKAFASIRRAEIDYGRQLRKVARNVGDIITAAPKRKLSQIAALQNALGRYAEIITPWAEVTAARMVAEVNRRDKKAWLTYAAEMGQALRAELHSAPSGLVLRDFLAEQVALITSLPVEAGQRVHKLTLEGLANSTRAAEISKEIARSGEVTKSRADLIARTEVARTASGLTMSRATEIGSEGYIWRTAGDADVRPSHRAMAGNYVAWSTPPTLDGMTGHAGMFPNCRCYPEPVLP